MKTWIMTVLIGACALVQVGCISTQGGALGVAEGAGIVGESDAKKARRVAEWLVGKGEVNPVRGWDYDAGVRYVGTEPVESGKPIRPQDIEAWATYSTRWKPLDAQPAAPAVVPGTVPAGPPPVSSGPPVLWEDKTGEIAAGIQALFEAADREGGQ